MNRRDIVDGYIHVVQEKTGADLQIPIHPTLMATIKATPSNGFAILSRKNGQPIQRQTLTAMMAKAVKEAGLPAYCVPHGIRKSTMRRLAEGGATSKEIAAISGHQTLKGTSNNCHRSSGAPNLPTNDSALFSFRFCAVHPKDLRDSQLLQLFEVPSRKSSVTPTRPTKRSSANPPWRPSRRSESER
jgi:Phage integrase family